MCVPGFQTGRRPTREGARHWRSWQGRLRAARLRAFRILGIPAEEPEITIEDDLTDADIQVYEDPLFTLITVKGRPFYIHR